MESMPAFAVKRPERLAEAAALLASAPDARLLVGCQVGGRAVRAAQILASFGFSDVSVVRGGFAGARDPMGRVVDPGWADAGLPVATGADDGGAYRDVLAKADAGK